MKDPYAIPEISEAPAGPPAAPSASPRGAVSRPVLWLLLVLSATGNMVTSTAGVNVAVSSAFGLVTLACATALVVQHRRNRRR